MGATLARERWKGILEAAMVLNGPLYKRGKKKNIDKIMVERLSSWMRIWSNFPSNVSIILVTGSPQKHQEVLLFIKSLDILGN